MALDQSLANALLGALIVPVWPAFVHGGSAPLQQSRRKSAQAIARDEHIGVLVQQCDHEHLFGVVATCRCS
jgi:hypothetical protein